MSSSTLDPSGEETPITGLGHGTRALGPSDSSDTGSDVVGGPGMDEGLSEEQARRMPLSTTHGAGRDLGDENLDSDSDRSGTGERGSAGLQTPPIDRQTTLRPGIESAADEFDDLDTIGDVDAEIEPDEGSASVSDGAT